jgi:hypothetical protein
LLKVLHKADIEAELRRAGAKYRELLPASSEQSGRILQVVRYSGRRSRSYQRNWPRDIGLTAALLLVVAVAGIGASQLRGRLDIAKNPSVSGASGGSGLLPQEDLQAAGLSSAGRYITSFHLPGQSGAENLTLIGAYADSAQTVLFLRGDGADPSTLNLYDDSGWINSYTRVGAGAPGDRFLRWAIAPHADGNGLAHLSVTDSQPVIQSGTPSGRLLFSFWIRVYRATALTVPAEVDLGSWQVKFQRLEVTPATVYLRAIIDGASADDLGSSPVTLVTESGATLTPIVAGNGAIVSKQDLTSATAKQTVITYQWTRPAPGTYELRITGAGAVRTIPLTIPSAYETVK